MNAFIRKIDSMVQLPDEQRRVLARLTEQSHLLEPRTRIINAGEQSSPVNIVLSGWACRCKILPDGQRQIITILLPGDMCDPYVLSRHVESHVISTLTPVTLAKIPRDVIRDLTTDPRMAEIMWLQMLEAEEIQREWTVSLGRRTAKERLAHLYCEIVTRLEALGLANGHDCDMPLTQMETADVIGLSAIHVNRSLHELRATGLIEFRNKRLTILNRQALVDLAMFDPAYLHRRPC